MNKNALYFTIHIEKPFQMYYYGMLWYALKKLEPFYSGGYDVVVFYSFGDKGISFETAKYNNKFNMYEDFPWVKFIKSDYNEKYTIHKIHGDPHLADSYMTKWYNLHKIFDLGYEKVFYTDGDIIFFGDIGYYFEKYSQDKMWILHENVSELTEIMLGRQPMMSGQFMIHKNLFNKIDNFFEKALEKRKYLNEKAIQYLWDHKITEQQYKDFIHFNEQYCAQLTFVDHDIEFEELQPEDYTTHHRYGSRFKLSVEDGVVKYLDVSTVVMHYSGAKSAMLLPPELHTPWLAEGHSYFLKKYNNRGVMDRDPTWEIVHGRD
jgi:hypothetical protein